MQALRHPQVNMAELAVRLEPQSAQLERVSLHSLTVRGRLNASFNLKKFVRIGSHSRGTAIRNYSDIDFLAVLARNEAKWGGDIISSSTFLRKVRQDLQDRYAHTEVRRDGQAVVVDFGGGQHAMDVVPGIFSRFDKLHPVYFIPDGFDGWLETSPEAHNRYFARSNEKSSGKLVRLIRLLKWWKVSRANPIPLASFHLDMLMASSDVCVGVKSYTRCLHDAFKLLADRECRGLQDPVGISGVICAAKSDAQWQDNNNAVSYALEHAKNAIHAEAWKDFGEANRQWNIVFNGNF